jgi:hypothetical protein
MKNVFFFAFTWFTLIGFSQSDPEKFSVNIAYSFKNIEAGYDHVNKIIVYVDGREAGQSKPKNQSDRNSLKIQVTKGKHEIKVENWAYYNDQWELHDTENGYSFDLINTETMNVTKNKSMIIVYDLDEGVDVSVK